MEQKLKILLIFIIILIIILIIKYFTKKKDNNILIEDHDTNYSIASIEILKKHFREKDFYQNTDINDLKNKLGVTSVYTKGLPEIINLSQHKINIQYSHSINTNNPYINLNSLKTCANEVIDYCVKNTIPIKKAIVLFLLTIDSQTIKDIVDEEIEDEKYIEDFYIFLPKFIEKYNIKNIN